MPERRRSTLRFAAAIVAGLLALAACRDSGGEGEWFAVKGKLFEFNYRLGIATYVITLDALQPFGEGNFAVVHFEDPAGGEPLVLRQRLWPKLRHQTVTSPPLSCVIKDRPYAVDIRIEDPKGALLQRLAVTMTSNLDQSILPDRPLVIGPVYELNPDMSGHPDGKLDSGESADCPNPL